MRSSFPPGCLALIFIVMLAFILPFFLADAVLTALGKLGMTPYQSMMAAFGIFIGGMVNIPIKRMVKEEPVSYQTRNMFGINRLVQSEVKQQSHTLLAVNLGGCIIPLIISIYEISRLFSMHQSIILAFVVSAGLNIWICYSLARPIQNMGIALNPVIPALAAAACAYLFAPSQAPSVAFVSGVLGPLVGADLLHLRDISKISTGVASIGGAGTFDGIILSGIVATLLA